MILVALTLKVFAKRKVKSLCGSYTCSSIAFLHENQTLLAHDNTFIYIHAHVPMLTQHFFFIFIHRLKSYSHSLKYIEGYLNMHYLYIKCAKLKKADLCT